jgi:hypothetical protein
MTTMVETASVPGKRIAHYRNSSPRLIRLIGLGDAGSRIVQTVARQGLSNVEIRTEARPIGSLDIADTGHDRDTNMIVIVCGEGDEGLFRPEGGRPDTLVTFVLLQSAARESAAHDRRLATARGFSDLFVTTSDVDYVADLIGNLAG